MNSDLEYPAPKLWRETLERVAPYVLAGSLISSGWWKGKTRYWVLGASALGVAAAFLQDHLAERQRLNGGDDLRDEGSPIARILDTIFFYALEDGATQIRLIRSQAIKVEYLVGDEWVETMNIPLYIWAALRNEATMRASGGSMHFKRGHQNHEVSLRILIEPPKEEMVLTVK